jgi:hypothetical protein
MLAVGCKNLKSSQLALGQLENRFLICGSRPRLFGWDDLVPVT